MKKVKNIDKKTLDLLRHYMDNKTKKSIIQFHQVHTTLEFN